ncbi:MAG TPA: serine/threonine-protein kinase [Verrucomicrobiae bacterium]
MDERLPPLFGTPTQPIEPAAEGVPLRVVPPSVPDHEFFQRIGAGAYGEVWLARNLATGAPRAVKIVHRSTFADERPFNREFEGIKKFDVVSRSHPGQLALFHVGRNDAAGYFYYVMELADSIPLVGDDVRSLTSNSEIRNQKSEMGEPPHVGCYVAHTLRADLEHGRLPAARVLEIALALTEALAHLHANALIHRDVKPSNIIFVGGRPKLADIGLVTDASDSRSIVGTEGYLPPEGPGTPAADIFALGKVLYEALTGLDRRQYPELPADLRQWPDAAPAFELNLILVKACAADARERYASAEAMLADLKLLDAGKSVKRRRSVQRGWAWSWKAAVAVALVTLGILLVKNNRDNRAEFTKLERAQRAWQNATPFQQSGTTNRAAWEASERAGTLSTAFTPVGFSNAVQEYERAVELDPNYAAAWIDQAMALFLSVEKGYVSGSDALPRALFCAEKGTKLDPSDAWGWEWVGECTLALTYDFTRAEPILRKGVQLAQHEPQGWNLRNNLACLLWFYGRFDEAEAILVQIIREQPSEGYSNSRLGLIYASQGRFADAVTSLGECILLQPNWPEAYIERGEILWALNRRPEAARDWLRYVELGGFASLTHEDAAMLNTTLDQDGPDGFLRSLLEVLERRRAEGKFVSAYDLARLYAEAENKARALDYLETAVDEHRTYVLSAKVDIVFKDFHDEPRYHAVLRRLKLEK